MLNTFSENVEVIAQSIAFVSGLLIAKYAASLGVVLASQLLLIERTTKATVVTNTYGQVVSRTSRVQNVAALASRGLASAMSLIGGPVGAATLAVSALIFFADKAETASQRTERLSGDVDDLTDSFKGLNDLQRKIEIQKISTDMAVLSNQLVEANKKLNQFRGFAESPIKTQNINKLEGDIASLNKELDNLSVKQQAIFQSGTPQLTEGARPAAGKPQVPQTATTDISALRSRLALETDALAAELDNQRALRNGEINQRQFDDEAELQQLRFKFEERRLAIEENETLTATNKERNLN